MNDNREKTVRNVKKDLMSRSKKYWILCSLFDPHHLRVLCNISSASSKSDELFTQMCDAVINGTDKQIVEFTKLNNSGYGKFFHLNKANLKSISLDSFKDAFFTLCAVKMPESTNTKVGSVRHMAK